MRNNLPQRFDGSSLARVVHFQLLQLLEVSLEARDLAESLLQRYAYLVERPRRIGFLVDDIARSHDLTASWGGYGRGGGRERTQGKL